MKDLEFIKRVLKATEDDTSSLLWYFIEDEVRFCVNANDNFWWGTADAEDITPRNIEVLEQAYKDIEACGGYAYFGSMLFSSRVRKMRPQGAAYPKDKALWFLFDACGPEREIDILNPYAPGERA